jgi:glycerol kinase
MRNFSDNGEAIITIDQSTQSTKGFLFALNGEILEQFSLPHKQHYPRPGWVEHDPDEIFRNTLRVIKVLARKADKISARIVGITITNQRETVVIWDRKTGKPLYNAIVWQCMRGADICESIKARGFEELIKEKTGLVVDPYFSASKIAWVIENKGISPDRMLAGTIDSWLIWKLTNGEAHVTDYTNASRTMLFNINKLDWDDEILELFKIPRSAMPEAMPSNSIFCYTNCDNILSQEIPISGVMGDSHAALFGHGCFDKGMIKATYGTGSSIMMNIGNEFLLPPKGIVTSIGWGIDSEVVYVFEGNVHSAGAAITWLIDNLRLVNDVGEIEPLCQSVEDTEGVYFIPAFSGLGAPYWESKARGLIYGLTLKTEKAHIVRAAVESVAYQVRDVVEVIKSGARVKLSELRADGGMAKNSFLMQFQADILGTPVIRSHMDDMAAFGSFLMGELGFRIRKNMDDIASIINSIPRDIFLPKLSEAERERRYELWKYIVRKSMLEDFP